MALENYHVLRDIQSGKIGIYYTYSLDSASFQEEFDEDISTKEEIPFESWTEDITANVMSEILEGCNYHHMVELPDVLLQSLKAANISTYDRSRILRIFLKQVLESDLI